MKTTIQYLDAAKKALGIESDYALAPHLGLTKQAISKLRNRPLVMSNTTAVYVAEILGVDPMKVIADAELERGTNDELWTRIARKVAAVMLAPLVGGAFFIGPSGDAQASAVTLHNANVEYTLRSIRRWLAAMLGALAFSVTATSAHADALDAALLGGALTTLAIDWGQTRAIAQNPGRFEELNPILGAHPSVGRVNSYFALAMLGTAGLAFALPREHSRIFLGGLILLETTVIVRNDGIGIRARF